MISTMDHKRDRDLIPLKIFKLQFLNVLKNLHSDWSLKFRSFETSYRQHLVTLGGGGTRCNYQHWRYRQLTYKQYVITIGQ